MSEMIRKTHLTSPDSDGAQHVKLAHALCGLSREMSVPGQQEGPFESPSIIFSYERRSRGSEK